jgi:hypothetical protein
MTLPASVTSIMRAWLKGQREEVLDQALDAFLVAGLQAHALVHAESGVLKTPPDTWGSAPGRSRA